MQICSEKMLTHIGRFVDTIAAFLFMFVLSQTCKNSHANSRLVHKPAQLLHLHLGLNAPRTNIWHNCLTSVQLNIMDRGP